MGVKWGKLCLDTKENTVLMAGRKQFTIDELEDKDSEINKKLETVEPYLKKYRK